MQNYTTKASANLLVFSFVLLVNIPVRSVELPFKENCSAMQAYFNGKKWVKETKFINFTSNEFPNRMVSRLNGNKFVTMSCANGYVIETSPLGKRVCRAMLTYGIWDYRASQYKIDQEKAARGIVIDTRMDWKPLTDKITGKDDCRWK